MKPKRIAVLLVPLATVAALTVAAGQPSQASQVSQSSQSSQSSGGIPNLYGAGPWVLRNRASNLCLSLLPQNSSKGIQVVQEACNQSNAVQGWRFLAVASDGSVYRVQNVATGMCLRAVANKDFSVVDTMDCTGISNERWFIEAGTLGSEISTGGEPVLDLYEALPQPGNTFDVFHFDNTPAQSFDFMAYISPLAAKA
jgi:ricin-type beta-trefoil lectin protein